MANAIRNPGFEEAPPFVAATTGSNVWIDGTSTGSTTNNAYFWTIPASSIAGSVAAQFDTSVFHSGIASMKVSTLNSLGVISISHARNTGSVLIPSQFIPSKISTAYTLTGWVKTNNVNTNAVWIRVQEYNSGGTNTHNNDSVKFSGTNDWTLVTINFTSRSDTAYLSISLIDSAAGNIGDAWLDDLYMDDGNGNFIMYNNLGLGR